ncbi:MAG TPA: hypothetical protein VF573_11230 [Paraburkholderia sp.]
MQYPLRASGEGQAEQGSQVGSNPCSRTVVEGTTQSMCLKAWCFLHALLCEWLKSAVDSSKEIARDRQGTIRAMNSLTS